MDQQMVNSESEVVSPLAGLPRVLEIVGLGRTAWLERVKEGTAPQPIKVGRRTLWVEAEVFGFVAACVRRHRGSAANTQNVELSNSLGRIAPSGRSLLKGRP